MMSSFSTLHILSVSLLWDVYLSFEIPDYCHSHSIVNGTRCCAFLYDECVHAAETQFNCTAAPQNSLPYGGNLLNLTMSKCGLNGNIPTNITLLPYLQSLDLSGNFLVGTIPDDIGEIGKDGTGLEVMDLSDNNLEGIIPTSIANCLELKHLDISINYLTRMSLPALVQLTELEYLDLSDNQIVETYHETLHSFSNLKTLNLGTNRISGSIPYTIGALTELEVLNMERNDMTGSLPVALSQLVHLKVLNVSDNKFEGSIPSEWSDHWTEGQLEHLNLGQNLFDCPVHDYSAYAQDTDFIAEYGENGRSNCESAASTGNSTGLSGVEVGIIVIAAIIVLALTAYGWQMSVTKKRQQQLKMLTDEDVFDD